MGFRRTPRSAQGRSGCSGTCRRGPQQSLTRTSHCGAHKWGPGSGARDGSCCVRNTRAPAAPQGGRTPHPQQTTQSPSSRPLCCSCRSPRGIRRPAKQQRPGVCLGRVRPAVLHRHLDRTPFRGQPPHQRPHPWSRQAPGQGAGAGAKVEAAAEAAAAVDTPDRGPLRHPRRCLNRRRRRCRCLPPFLHLCMCPRQAHVWGLCPGQ